MRLATTATLAAASAAFIAASTTMASAADYTISAGGSTTGTATFTAATTGASPQVKFTVVGSGLELTCTSGTASGTATLGAAATGAAAANIDATTWTGCLGPLDLPMNVTHVGSWAINATGTTVGGVTAGTITNVSAQVRSTAPGQCDFDVAGSVDSSYNNNQSLSVTAPTTGQQLIISNVSGCFGQIIDGDEAQFVATYGVTSSPTPLTITSN